MVFYKVISGSRLYGTSHENSDYDYRAIKHETTEYYLSLSKKDDVFESIKDGDDNVIYDLKKFLALAKSNNPNILEILFADSSKVIISSEKSHYLRSKSGLFLNKNHIKNSFLGYAHSQYQRLTNHKGWLDRFPKIHSIVETALELYKSDKLSSETIKEWFGGDLKEKCVELFGKKYKTTLTKEDFCQKFIDGDTQYFAPEIQSYITMKNISTFERIPVDLEFIEKKASLRVINKNLGILYSKGGGVKNFNKSSEVIEGIPLYILTFDMESYEKEKYNIECLYRWYINRNVKRSHTEREFGYDLKHGNHCIRLLIFGRTLLDEGFCNPTFSGTNLSLLKSILNGEVPYEDYIKLMEEEKQKFSLSFEKSSLKDYSEDKEIDKVFLDILNW